MAQHQTQILAMLLPSQRRSQRFFAFLLLVLSEFLNSIMPFLSSFLGVLLQLLSWKPRAYIFPGFADAEKCDKIVAHANKSMFPSTLALRAGEDPESQKDVRTR